MLALALAVPVKDDAMHEEEATNFFYKVGTASSFLAAQGNQPG